MTGKEEFAARIARIQSGKAANLIGTIHVGSHEDLPVKGARAARAAIAAPSRGPFVLPALGAFVLGLAAMALGHVGQFQLMRDQPAPDADTAAAVSIGIALLIAFVAGIFLRLTRKSQRIMSGLGLIVMASLFHNLAHWAPRPMALAFSPEWVQEVRASTPANTIWYRNGYFPLVPALADVTAALSPAEPVAEAPVDPAAQPCPKPEAPAVTILQTDHAKKKPKAAHKNVAVPADTTCAAP